MLTFLHRILDTLFPVRNSELLVRQTSDKNIQLLLSLSSYQGTVTLLPYELPIVRALIRENKFYNNEKAQKLLAQIFEAWLVKQNDECIFLPMPLSVERHKERGHNQVHSVLQKVSNLPKQRILEGFLVRRKNTVAQSSLPKSQRILNMKDAFIASTTPEDLSGKTLVLIDDVITTGSTMAAARASLAPHLPHDTKLVTLAFAH